MKWLFLLVLVFISSCSGTKQEEVGKYVYVDCYRTVHIDRECASKLSENPKTKEERMANMIGVNFVDTCYLTGKYNPYNAYVFCPKCIDDEAYKHLQTIMERNEEKNSVKPPAY